MLRYALLTRQIRFWSTFWWRLCCNCVIRKPWHCITLLIDRVTNIVRCTCLAFQSIFFKTFLNKSLSSSSNILQGFRQALSISKVTDFRLALRQPCCILLWTESYLLFTIHLLKCCRYHLTSELNIFRYEYFMSISTRLKIRTDSSIKYTHLYVDSFCVLLSAGSGSWESLLSELTGRNSGRFLKRRRHSFQHSAHCELFTDRDIAIRLRWV